MRNETAHRGGVDFQGEGFPEALKPQLILERRMRVVQVGRGARRAQGSLNRFRE